MAAPASTRPNPVALGLALAKPRDEESVEAALEVVGQDAQGPGRGDRSGGRAAFARLDRPGVEVGPPFEEGGGLRLALLGLQRADAIDQPPARLDALGGGVKQARL